MGLPDCIDFVKAIMLKSSSGSAHVLVVKKRHDVELSSACEDATVLCGCKTLQVRF